MKIPIRSQVQKFRVQRSPFPPVLQALWAGDKFAVFFRLRRDTLKPKALPSRWSCKSCLPCEIFFALISLGSDIFSKFRDYKTNPLPSVPWHTVCRCRVCHGTHLFRYGKVPADIRPYENFLKSLIFNLTPRLIRDHVEQWHAFWFYPYQECHVHS